MAFWGQYSAIAYSFNNTQLQIKTKNGKYIALNIHSHPHLIGPEGWGHAEIKDGPWWIAAGDTMTSDFQGAPSDKKKFKTYESLGKAAPTVKFYFLVYLLQAVYNA